MLCVWRGRQGPKCTQHHPEQHCSLFASRRRHTRFDCDWSSDVCSSDLFEGDDSWHVTGFERAVSHPLLRGLKERDAPGLVLFSSGSTGESKASVLDFDRLLAKFEVPRPAYRMLVFLLLDHIGGINTLLYGLCHGGTIVTTRERTPDAVCAAIEARRIELLPTTPTFLRILLIADAIRRYDLSSLKIVTYGTEPMPPSTLAVAREALPWLRFKQTYGLS